MGDTTTPKGQAPAGAGEAAEHYRNAIARACEGWTMPDGLRKHLETALWSPPTPQPTHAQAGAVPLTDEYPALVCDYCGALTPDPWHSSGMLHGKMSKHIHSCDACASRGQAPALTNLNCKSEQKRLATLWGFVPAQADSVLEEAARYRWLRDGNDAKHGAAWHVAVNLYGCEWDAAIDAARKRGERQ